MADADANDYGDDGITTTLGIAYGGNSYGLSPSLGGNFIAKLYVQRIYDNTLNDFVYYKTANINQSPQPTQTTPNHTGNLDTSKHEIVKIITEII